MTPRVVNPEDERPRELAHMDSLRRARPGPEAAPQAGRRWPVSAATAAFFLAAALAVYLRLSYQASFFPAFFEGEEAKVLDLAKGTCEFAAYTGSWWRCAAAGAIEYNKGYSWALVPFYLHYGYDVRLVTIILPVFFSLFCAAFFTIYRKVYPGSSLLSFALVIVFSVLCMSLRRYKWHSLAYLTAISVYLYLLPQYYKGAFFLGDRGRKALALFLFAFSCYFYFGCLVYAVPFVGLCAHFAGGFRRARGWLWAGAGTAVFAALVLAATKTTDVWRWRMLEELDYVKADFTGAGLLERWHATRDFFFTLDLSAPYLVVFAVGLVASLRRIRRGDWFALINTVLLLSLWALEVTVQGLNNPDQLNWSMLPLMGLLLIGADEILGAFGRFGWRGSALGAAMVLLVCRSEMDHYLVVNRDTPYQPYVQERNTMTQAALVLRMIRDDDSGSMRYYLPDPSVPEVQGGFNYGVNLNRVDFARALSRVVLFSSEGDLARKLAAQRDGLPAVAYLSVCTRPDPKDVKDAVDPLKAPLLGHDPEVIHPFEEVYRIRFLVRRFLLRPPRLQ